MPLLGNVNHAAAAWCFLSDRVKDLNTRTDEPDPMTIEQLAAACKSMGVSAIELADPKNYGFLKAEGFTMPMALVNPYAAEGIAPFVRGWNNPAYRARVMAATKAEIDAMKKFGWPNVIAFTGYSVDPTDKGTPISRRAGFLSCVAGLKEVAKYAEANNVTVCVEHLSTRDLTHPMKSHPGYQGDDLDWVARIVRAVNSRRIKLLFDIYHVQLMHGDVIRRMLALIAEGIVGHVHTADCPGRGEVGSGELNYTNIMKALVGSQYKGYVGHEQIPVWDNKTASLLNSVTVCDV